MIGIPTLALVLAITQPAPTPAPVVPPSSAAGSPVPSESSTVSPPTMPPPTPATTPTASTTPIPSLTAPASPIAYGYRYVPGQPAHPEPGVPQIFAVYLNSRTLASRGPIEIKVVTDPGTVKVTSRSGGRVGVIPMIAPGDFEANSTLPKLPFIAAGMTIQLDFTALASDGRKVTVHVPVALK